MKIKHLFITLFALFVGATSMYGADAPVKREMRSAWVATVWRLDWPQTSISSTGNATQINRQKADLITLLDSMKVNNMNAVNFQVRSRCDALYKSSYEPWSSDLVSTRGLDPGYDPLQFCIEECHKRGMECHAWINPYRYESVSGQWNGTPKAYRTDHPDWIMDVTNSSGETASILNPGKPEVTQRICDILAEIVTNYDVDGILYDDYFYLSGTTASADATLYNAYKSAGGTLSQNDWRRENVNQMIDASYKTIKKIKPWVRFGVSPAGIACTSSSVAAKYGISPCPTGSDWQYSDIFSDPIAWVSRQSLDFISPQIYWTIGNSTDYDKACKWWSDVAHKWNRHFYSSHSISSLTSASKAPGVSIVEDGISTLASGPNATTFDEYANEVRLNRKYNSDDAPGSIFYSAKYLYRTAPLFAHSLKKSVFNTPALVPAMTWQAVSSPGNASNVQRSGSALSWSGPSNVRYTVYAVPTSISTQNFNREVEYLLGVSYSTQYTLPANRLSGYNYAVCVLDRYGNEYSPVFVGAATRTLDAPTLVSPTNGQTVEMPFDFSWNSVTNATNYIVEVATNSTMSDLLYTVPVQATSVSTDAMYGLPVNKTLYWRVRACGNSYNDGVSGSRSFTAKNLVISSPADGAEKVSLTPEISWTIPERDVTIEISKSSDFGTLVYSAKGSGGKHKVAANILSAYTTYYVRALYQRNGKEYITPAVCFTTLEMTPAVPTVSYPIDKGILHADESIAITPSPGYKALRLEVCADTKFSARAVYVQSSITSSTWADPKKASEIKIGTKALVDGTEYYIRVRGSYATASGESTTEYCTPVSFTYSASEGGVNDITVNAKVISTEWFDLTGRLVSDPTSGTYIRRQTLDNGKINITKEILK